MFEQRTLLSALAAITFLEKVAAIPVDNAAYTDFANYMTTDGSGYGWQAYQIPNFAGNNLSMFRLTTDASGTALTDTKGPILLQHGMFSDVLDWLERPDTETDALPIKLAAAGYDVWMSVARGRPGSDTHTTLDLSVDADYLTYWDFSFLEQGTDDLENFVDEIIAQRGRSTCSKVSLLTHGTAANAAVAGLTFNATLEPKVQQLLTVGPCLNIDTDTFYIPAFKDPGSSITFKMFLDGLGLQQVFGPDLVAKTTNCGAKAFQDFCDAIQAASTNWPYAQMSSLKDQQHVLQNSIYSTFGTLEPAPSVTPTPYNISGIGIDVKAIYGSADDICYQSINAPRFAPITSYTDSVNAMTHLALINTNSDAYVAEITAQLAAAPVELGDGGICPVEINDDPECSSSSSSSCSDKEPQEPKSIDIDYMTRKLNKNLEKTVRQIDRFMTKGKGEIDLIQSRVNNIEAMAINMGISTDTLPLFAECMADALALTEEMRGTEGKSGSGSKDKKAKKSKN